MVLPAVLLEVKAKGPMELPEPAEAFDACCTNVGVAVIVVAEVYELIVSALLLLALSLR